MEKSGEGHLDLTGEFEAIEARIAALNLYIQAEASSIRSDLRGLKKKVERGGYQVKPSKFISTSQKISNLHGEVLEALARLEQMDVGE